MVKLLLLVSPATVVRSTHFGWEGPGFENCFERITTVLRRSILSCVSYGSPLMKKILLRARPTLKGYRKRQGWKLRTVSEYQIENPDKNSIPNIGNAWSWIDITNRNMKFPSINGSLHYHILLQLFIHLCIFLTKILTTWLRISDSN